jgi:hypothetical protein
MRWLYHLTAGFKMTNARAVDPRYGTPLSCLEDGVGQPFSKQS